MAQIRVTPSGNLDKDGDLAYISGGNYVDANDIRHRNIDGNKFGGITPTNGNKFSSILPNISPTVKKYRFYLDRTKFASSAVASMGGILYLQTTAGNIYSQTVNLTPSSLANFATSIQTALNIIHGTAYGSAFTFGTLISTATDKGYFTVTTASDTDYILRVANANADVPLCKIVLEEEYIASATTLKAIGSFQLEDYLFVWSASDAVSSGITSLVSEIGVVFTPDQGQTYQYRTLVRSKKLGFSKERRIDAQMERVGSQINFYWTDGNEKPRAMYLDYSNVLVGNGFMFWNGGRYELENIDIESTFFTPVSSAYFSSIEVVNVGGTLTAGNKRYTGRFLSEDLVPTEFIYPTNPVNIYLADTDEPYKITGNDADVITSKSVKLTLTNFPSGVFKYFELVVLEYVDETYTATIVQRYSIGEQDTKLEVVHTKNGQDNLPLGVNELVAIYSRYLKAESMRIYDNRMVLSNVTEQVDADLSAWAQQITHSLEAKTIPALGRIVDSVHDFIDDTDVSTSPSPAMLGLKHGLSEYLDPLNVYSNTSYMFNDTYRFGIQVKWKATGKWSAPYYVDDIRFDDKANNVIGTRRSANNITSNLTDSNDANVYIYYVRFGNVNLDYLVNGTPLRDLIEGFRFVRAERIPEVVATGYFFLGDIETTGITKPFTFGSTGSTSVPNIVFDATDVIGTDTIQTATAHQLFQNQPLLFEEDASGVIGNLVNNKYYYADIVNTTQFKLKATPTGNVITLTPASGTNHTLRTGPSSGKHSISPTNGSNVLYFHSPDNFYIEREYDYSTTTDAIKLLGPTKNVLQLGTIQAAIGTGIYADLTGYFSSTKREYLTMDNTSTPRVRDYAILDLNKEKYLTNIAFTARNKTNISNDVFGLSTTLRYSTGSYFAAGLANGEDEGIYYGQIFKNLGANKKYPANVENTIYQNIGHFYYLSNGQHGILNNIDVFGGDVFNQKTYLPISVREGSFGGRMIGCYSQNRVNTQMYTILEDDGSAEGFGYRWPAYGKTTTTTTASSIRPTYFAEGFQTAKGSIWDKLANFLAQTIYPQRAYNRGYDYRDGSIMEQGFLANPRFTGESPTKVIWSAKKITGSQKDGYRIGYSPTNFAELDMTFGPIVHHEIVNNAFYTVQPFSFQRQYFRDASLLGADAGTDIVIGSGSILGAPGQELTSIGADYKWSIVKGQTPAGKESLYWFNNRLKKMVRLAQDGISVISDKGIISLLQNNTNWLFNKKYPLSGAGIHGVWNDKYGEAIFTFKALNPNIAAWVTATGYTAGTYVYISPIGTYLHASNLPYVYKCKLNHTSDADTKPETGVNWQTYWEKVTPGTNPETHTTLTLVYDELKNGFIGTHSYWPDIYLPYQNTFWSPDPLNPRNLYLHDANGAQIYYGTAYIPSLTAVMNYDPNLSKNFEALQVVSDEVPSDMDLFTKNHQSFLVDTDFDLREDYYYSPIKNDILTGNGLPTADTSRLWGKWLKLKFYFDSVSGKQKLLNFIVKFRPMPRLYNQ